MKIDSVKGSSDSIAPDAIGTQTRSSPTGRSTELPVVPHLSNWPKQEGPRPARNGVLPTISAWASTVAREATAMVVGGIAHNLGIVNDHLAISEDHQDVHDFKTMTRHMIAGTHSIEDSQLRDAFREMPQSYKENNILEDIFPIAGGHNDRQVKLLKSLEQCFYLDMPHQYSQFCAKLLEHMDSLPQTSQKIEILKLAKFSPEQLMPLLNRAKREKCIDLQHQLCMNIASVMDGFPGGGANRSTGLPSQRKIFKEIWDEVKNEPRALAELASNMIQTWRDENDQDAINMLQEQAKEIVWGSDSFSRTTFDVAMMSPGDAANYAMKTANLDRPDKSRDAERLALMHSMVGDAARKCKDPTEAVLAVMYEIMPHISANPQTRYLAILLSVNTLAAAGKRPAISAMTAALNASGPSKQVGAEEVANFICNGIYQTNYSTARDIQEAAGLMEKWGPVVKALVSAHPHLFLARQGVPPRPQLGETNFFATDPEAGLKGMAAFLAEDQAALGAYEKNGTAAHPFKAVGGLAEHIRQGTGKRIEAIWEMAAEVAEMPIEVKQQVAKQLSGHYQSKYPRIDDKTKRDIDSYLTPSQAEGVFTAQRQGSAAEASSDVGLPFEEGLADVVVNFKTYANAELAWINQRVLCDRSIVISKMRGSINRDTCESMARLLAEILQSGKTRPAAPELVRELLRSHLANIVSDPEAQCMAVVRTLQAIDDLDDDEAKRAIRESLVVEPSPDSPEFFLDDVKMFQMNDAAGMALRRRWQTDAIKVIRGFPESREAKELPQLLELKELQSRYSRTHLLLSQGEQMHAWSFRAPAFYRVAGRGFQMGRDWREVGNRPTQGGAVTGRRIRASP